MDSDSPDQVCKIPLLQEGSSREVNITPFIYDLWDETLVLQSPGRPDLPKLGGDRCLEHPPKFHIENKQVNE